MSKKTITHVRKNEQGVITHVKVSDTYTKSEVISQIQHGTSFIVPSGTEVHVVDGKYIRSDRNNTSTDNLGELPSFELPPGY
jgi:hypothetical protein